MLSHLSVIAIPIATLQIQFSQKKSKTAVNIPDTKWLPVASNVAERLFSRAKHVLSQYRMRILPRHLEGQIFLMVNESFWDVELVNKLF